MAGMSATATASLPDAQGRRLLHLLDELRIACGTGS